MLDPTSAASDFTSLHFSIERECVIVADQTFATIAAANTYFNDHALNFGPLKSGVTGTLDLTFLLEMTTLDNGTRYNVNVLVADVGLAAAGLPNEYNNDNFVDAADYTVWRNNLGTNLDLNGNGDETGDSMGIVDEADYTWWKQHCGNSNAGGGGLTQSTVPEPTTLTMLLMIALSLLVLRHAMAS